MMWGASPKVAVATFVFRPDGMFPILRRSKGCGIGTWALPGGAVDNQETIRAASVREVREETDLRIQGNRIIAVTELPLCECGDHWITFWLKSEGSVSGRLTLNNEHDDFRWVRWGDWPRPLWQPYWDNLFDTLNDSRQVTMLGGLREKGEI